MIKRECFDKKLRKYSIIFFVNARLKLASKIPVSNPYFKQYVFFIKFQIVKENNFAMKNEKMSFVHLDVSSLLTRKA